MSRRSPTASSSRRAGDRVLVFEDEAGISKTTGWREVVRRAGERGFRVLVCRPAEMETSSRCWPWPTCSSPSGEAFAALPSPQRRALEVALLRVESEQERLDPRTLATAVRSLLAELTGERPLLAARLSPTRWGRRSVGRP
jgi:hypothetical protein